MAEGPTFAEEFERLRISRGLSPAELARELNEYEGNISRWRRGGGIELVKVRKIADYFRVSRTHLERLAGYDPGESSVPSRASPRLAAFLAQIEAAFHSLSEQ